MHSIRTERQSKNALSNHELTNSLKAAMDFCIEPSSYFKVKDPSSKSHLYNAVSLSLTPETEVNTASD